MSPQRHPYWDYSNYYLDGTVYSAVCMLFLPSDHRHTFRLDLPSMDLHCHTFRLEWATLEVKRARYYYNSFAKIEKVNIFTSFYVIFTVKYAVIEEFCVILQRSSEHVLLKQRSVMLDLRIET